MRYKPVAFGRSDCGKATAVPGDVLITTVVPETVLESTTMELAEPLTVIDPKERAYWHIVDAIVRLRLWGAEYAYPLPELRVLLKIGSGAGCEVQLHDRMGRLSREHALLVPEPAGWAA